MQPQKAVITELRPFSVNVTSLEIEVIIKLAFYLNATVIGYEVVVKH